MKTLRLLLTALLLLLAHTLPAQSLINLKLGSGYKVGPAAMGIATNDFWNHYHPTNNDGTLFNDGVLVPLYSSDGTNLAAGLLVYGVQTSGTNATGDSTLDSCPRASGTGAPFVANRTPATLAKFV